MSDASMPQCERCKQPEYACTCNASEGAEVVEQFYDRSIRYLIEMPDKFVIARWPRDADVATIAACILGTLKYEPHAGDTAAPRCALERVIDHAARILNRDLRVSR